MSITSSVSHLRRINDGKTRIYFDKTPNNILSIAGYRCTAVFCCFFSILDTDIILLKKRFQYMTQDNTVKF